jgi:hypothetical protein
MQVTATHKAAVYVTVEKFEHMLVDFTCSLSDHGNFSTLVFAFDTTKSITIAHDAWAAYDELLFVTHHVSCNPFDKRAVYKYELHCFKYSTFLRHSLTDLGRRPSPTTSTTSLLS